MSLRRQCALLNINRSTVYYRRRSGTDDEVDMMNRIRDIWEACPFYGYRKIAEVLRRDGHVVNHKRVRRLMGVMGIAALYATPKTSRPGRDHVVYPYLLRGVDIVRPDQVWQVDITYIKLPVGFAYLVALIDVYSRRIMGWRLSNSMSRTFCLEALEDALAQGVADIVNSDQGAQFTAKDWISALEDRGIRVSMDGKGRCLDNIFIERFWRSIKYEEVYLRVYESLPEARRCIGAYIDFYNGQRPHQSLDYKTPDEVYFEGGQRPVDMMDKPDGLPTSPRVQQHQSGDKIYLEQAV